MKYRYLTLFIVVSFINSYSQITFDTLAVSHVGPGVTYYHFKNYNVPWSINVIEADLTNKYLSVEAVKGGNKVDSLEQTSLMAKRNGRTGHTVIAATNSDFWRNSIPIGMQISQGEFVKTEGNYSRIFFNGLSKPFLDKILFSGKIIIKDSSAIIEEVNSAPDSNSLIIYNHYIGSFTPAGAEGTEAALSPLDKWTVNGTMRFKVDKVIQGSGHTKLEENQIILAGRGKAESLIVNNIKPGDVVKISFQLNPNFGEIKALTGGYPVLVKNGSSYAEQGMKEEGSPSGSTRHPRTAAGFSKDSTKLFLFTVDGRQASSAGMTITEWADFLVSSGVYYGINLDGGGSTTMVVRDSVVNSPSDKTGERKVCNSLQLISSAPVGNLDRIELNPKSVRIFHGDTCRYYLTGKDEFGNRKEIDIRDVQYKFSSNDGSITKDGLFIAGNIPDTAYVIASYNGYTDRARVITKTTAGLFLSPKIITADTSGWIEFSVYELDDDSVFHSVPYKKYQWKISDNRLGQIDLLGNFKGLSEGMAYITVSDGRYSDSAEVSISIFEGEKEIKGFINAPGIKISGNRTDSVNIYYDKEQLAVYYKYVADTLKPVSAALSFNGVSIPGTPKSLILSCESSLKDIGKASLIISDDNNELFEANGDVSGGKISFSLDNLVPKQISSKFYYPIKIKQIAISFTNEEYGKENEGCIRMESLKAAFYKSTLRK